MSPRLSLRALVDGSARGLCAAAVCIFEGGWMGRRGGMEEAWSVVLFYVWCCAEREASFRKGARLVVVSLSGSAARGRRVLDLW